MEIDQTLWNQILAAGIQAPSADNSQPWRFRVTGDQVWVSADPKHMGLYFDAAEAATLMSLGAVCENMILAAGRLGWEVELSRNPCRPSSGDWLFSLRLKQGKPVADGMADAIHRRGTDRFLYRRATRPPAPCVQAMAQALDSWPEYLLSWADAPKARKRLSLAVFKSDLVRFTHARIHTEFHGTLRFGARIEASGDGLAANTLGIERPMVPLLRMLGAWWLARFLNLLGLHYFMAWRGGTLPMWASGGVGVIQAPSNQDYFQWGRAMQRVWLAATQAGCAFQPLGALPLLLVRQKACNAEGLASTHQALLKEADGLWRSAVGAPANTELLMVFRVGMAKADVPRALRRPLGAFMDS